LFLSLSLSLSPLCLPHFAHSFPARLGSARRSADIAFILAFSVIMLNTDLHNPNLKEDRRMNKEVSERSERAL
tara:strand:+ start:54 stop:272 length:219 start_codon:yes stop_codon:yes gene_type:complete